MKKLTVLDFIQELHSFNLKAEISFEVMIIHDGITDEIEGLEYIGASERIDEVVIGVRGYK